MSTEKNLYAFTLHGSGMNFEREVDEATARALMHIALGGTVGEGNSVASISEGSSSSQTGKMRASADTVQSVREFLNAHEAKRNPEKIVAIGEYLVGRGAANFTKDDLLSQFRIAREAMPANFRRDLTWAVSTGWIAEDPDEAGSFYVTQTGKTAVDQKFSADIKKKSGFLSVRRRRRSK